MKCHMCGQREASIHLLELINGQQKSVWLCSLCAADQHDLSVDELGETVFGNPGQRQGESASLASFLGQDNDSGKVPAQVAPCPECGFEFRKFQESNRLGCARCYKHFQAQLRPILARFHRHASHLGKVPQQAGAAASRQGELTRIRVDLEKAIQGEDYEEAARLRDTMRLLVAEQAQNGGLNGGRREAMSDFFASGYGPDPQWLNNVGHASDIALCTRARLARNLADFPFPHQASDTELKALHTDLSTRISGLASFAGGWNLDLDTCDAAHRRVLVEKMLLPSAVVTAADNRGLVLAPDLSQSILINEEDHLRLQAYRPGFDPAGALGAVMALDDEMEAEVEAAFSPEWGYLAASPTNVGTGLRVSALLHLPGLVLVGEIEKVLNALRQLQFSVRGLWGKGNAVRGAIFQISNLITLGRSEQEIVSDFQVHVGKVITYERSARDQLYARDHLGIEDLVHRSRSILAGARIMTAQETFDCLSNIRLGEGLGILPPLPAGSLNSLMVHQQTAHLELATGRKLHGRDKGAARAALLREYFAAHPA